MKAAILVEQNAPLEVAELDIPKLQSGQVLVKLAYSGICGKQIDEISGRQGPDQYIPHLMGHEGGGVVLEVGPGVRHVKPDDHVVVHWRKGAGIDSAPPRFKLNGQTVSAGWSNTFSDHTIVSENRITPIRRDVNLDLAALMGCAVTTGLGAIFNDAALKPGQSAVIFGVGGVGQNLLQGGALVNAYPIVAIDVHDEKLERARHFGATHIFNSSQGDALEYLMDLTDKEGFDVSVDSVGYKKVRELAYQATKKTGKTIFVGVPPHDEPIEMHTYPIHLGRQLIGSSGGNTQPNEDIPRYLELYKRGKLMLNEQITHRYPLDAINEAISQVQMGAAGRVIIEMP